MKLFAVLLVAFVVWFATFSGNAGSGVTKRHAPRSMRHTPRLTPWTVQHRKRLRDRLTVVRAAQSLLGAPYVYGGATAAGVDCSGLTRFAYGQVGRVLPHLAAAQERLGRFVAQKLLRPGDLLFYNNGGHVALYVGNGQLIEASSARGRVIQTSIYEGWFVQTYDQARRLIG